MPVDESILGRNWMEPVPPVCPKCGYDLRESPEYRCPECGYRATFRELQQAARATRYRMRELEQLKKRANVGLVVSLSGLLWLTVSAGFGLGGLGVLVGFFCGLGSFGSGLAVWREKRRLPDSVGSCETEPEELKPAVATVLGAVLIVLSIALAL